jgi:hypothetical protein
VYVCACLCAGLIPSAGKEFIFCERGEGEGIQMLGRPHDRGEKGWSERFYGARAAIQVPLKIYIYISTLERTTTLKDAWLWMSLRQPD